MKERRSAFQDKKLLVEYGHIKMTAKDRPHKDFTMK